MRNRSELTLAAVLFIYSLEISKSRRAVSLGEIENLDQGQEFKRASGDMGSRRNILIAVPYF